MTSPRGLAGFLGEGAAHHGDLRFDGRVRIDGALIGRLESNDLVEIGAKGRVDGDVVAPQVLVAGTVTGRIDAAERVTLLETATVRGALVTPWLDVRVGCRLIADVRVNRD